MSGPQSNKKQHKDACLGCGGVLPEGHRKFCKDACRKKYERSGAKAAALPDTSETLVLVPAQAALRLGALLTRWGRPDGISTEAWQSLLAGRRTLQATEYDVLRLLPCASQVEDILGVQIPDVPEFTAGGVCVQPVKQR